MTQMYLLFLGGVSLNIWHLLKRLGKLDYVPCEGKLFLEGEAWIDKTLGKMSDTCRYIILYNNNDLMFVSNNDNAGLLFYFFL